MIALLINDVLRFMLGGSLTLGANVSLGMGLEGLKNITDWAIFASVWNSVHLIAIAKRDCWNSSIIPYYTTGCLHKRNVNNYNAVISLACFDSRSLSSGSKHQYLKPDKVVGFITRNLHTYLITRIEWRQNGFPWYSGQHIFTEKSPVSCRNRK
jgi:hypothetical protein